MQVDREVPSNHFKTGKPSNRPVERQAKKSVTVNSMVEATEEGEFVKEKEGTLVETQNGDEEVIVSNIIVPNASLDSKEEGKSESPRKIRRAIQRGPIRHLSEVRSLLDLNISMGSGSIRRITPDFIGSVIEN